MCPKWESNPNTRWLYIYITFGQSVSDYMIVNHEALQFCTKSEGVTMTECLGNFKFYQYIFKTCKQTDNFFATFG